MYRFSFSCATHFLIAAHAEVPDAVVRRGELAKDGFDLETLVRYGVQW